MSIPAFDPATGNLPPGIHDATWDELVVALGFSERRRELLQGLREALESLGRAGCERAYIDGSFATEKPVPGDFDGCWETRGVDLDLLDWELLDFDDHRAAQKARYKGEMFPADTPADEWGTVYLDFFQQTREEEPKGIVAIDPRTL